MIPDDRTVRILSNRIAGFAWGFMAIWVAMLALFTYLFLRDGGFHQFNPLIETGIMGLFWMFGLAGLGHAASKPLVFLDATPEGLTVTQRFPTRRVVDIVPAHQIPEPVVLHDRDDDGDPYFICELALAGAPPVVIAEGHALEDVEARRRHFLTVIRTAFGPALPAQAS